MVVEWLVVAIAGVVVAWLGWVYFYVVVWPWRGWKRGSAWVPRVAEVEVALELHETLERRARCLACGATEISTATSGLWDGISKLDGRWVGGSYWYGECEACGCRMGDTEGTVHRVGEEEWEASTRHPSYIERRKLEGPAASPTTVKDAVRRLMEEMTGDERDLVRGAPTEGDLEAFRFGLGLTIRNDFGLRGGNAKLLADCGVGEDDVEGAGRASEVILAAVRRRLIEVGSVEGMERARERWGRGTEGAAPSGEG